MIRIRLMHEGKAVKQISSRLHEGIVLEQIARFKEQYDTVQILEGELSEDAKSMLHHVAKKIVPAALAAGMAMSGAHAQQGGANPNYPGMDRSIGQHMSDIFSPDYKEKMRQRDYEKDTQRQEWNAKQNEIRRQRIEASRGSVSNTPGVQKNVTVYDQARPSADGKFYVIYGMDDRVTRIPVVGTEFMAADSQRLAHYIAPNGQVYYVRHSHNSEPKKENSTTLFNGVTESGLDEAAPGFVRHAAGAVTGALLGAGGAVGGHLVAGPLGAVAGGAAMAVKGHDIGSSAADALWDRFASKKDEEVDEEQVDELSKDTLKSYSKAAGHDVHADQRDAGGARDQAAHSTKHGDVKQSAAWKDEAEWLDKRAERRAGRIAKATTKIAQKEGVTEGVADSMTMDEAKKVLRHYGADNFKTTSNELHFYKNGKPFSVGLTLGDDSVRSVSLSSLNSATRGLKGVAEGYTVTRGIDKERFTERPGLEGPFSAKNGKVVYYDKVEGKYYDPETDFYIGNDDWQAMNEGNPNATVGTVPSSGTVAPTSMTTPTKFAPTGKPTAAKFNAQGQLELDDNAEIDDDAVKQLQAAGVKIAEGTDTLESILGQFSADYAKFKAGGDIDENQDFFDALYEYYFDEMPYGVQKARDGDPYEWITDRLDQESGVEPVAEAVESMTPNWAKYVLDQIYNSNGSVTMTDLFDEGIPGLHDMFMAAAQEHRLDPEEEFEEVQEEVLGQLEDIIKGGHGLVEADEVDAELEATPGEQASADQNIIMQIRKASDYEKPTAITLADGTEVTITQQTANKILTQFNKLMPQSKALMQSTLNTEDGFNQLLDYFGETAVANEVYMEAQARARSIIKSVFGK